MKSGTAEELVCPTCGFTQPDFKKLGRLGCPQCYSTFSDGLQSILKDMHKGTIHRGKVPARIAAAQAYHHRLADLRKELQKAVSDEKYERAASLRDEIVQIESHIKA
jgi:protein arginine kinase activator